MPEHSVVQTLVMEARRAGPPEPLLVLMHGDREVSTKQLARQIGAREVAPASPAAVEKHTGYVPGGVSPFGARKALPVHVERSVFGLPPPARSPCVSRRRRGSPAPPRGRRSGGRAASSRPPVAVHDDEQRLRRAGAAHLHDQCLDDRMLRHAERLRRSAGCGRSTYA